MTFASPLIALKKKIMMIKISAGWVHFGTAIIISTDVILHLCA